jgi:N-acetylated-alpha-linked acidic dipeptidase
VAAAIEDPSERRPVLDVWTEKSKPKLKPGQEKPFVGNDGEEPKVSDLGSGSDYTAFQHHLGVPSLDVQFEGPYGVYHSVLDDFFWMEKFGDPSFAAHRAMSRYLGVALLRVAGADLLPLRPEAQAIAIQNQVMDLTKIYPEVFAANSEKAKALEELRGASLRLANAAKALESEGERALEGGDDKGLDSVNSRLLRFERELLAKEGLRNRAFFRHLYSAPGVHAGYASSVLPGIREAITETPNDEARILTEIRRLTERVASATDLLEGKK